MGTERYPENGPLKYILTRELDKASLCFGHINTDGFLNSKVETIHLSNKNVKQASCVADTFLAHTEVNHICPSLPAHWDRVVLALPGHSMPALNYNYILSSNDFARIGVKCLTSAYLFSGAFPGFGCWFFFLGDMQWNR